MQDVVHRILLFGFYHPVRDASGPDQRHTGLTDLQVRHPVFALGFPFRELFPRMPISVTNSFPFMMRRVCDVDWSEKAHIANTRELGRERGLLGYLCLVADLFARTFHSLNES